MLQHVLLRISHLDVPSKSAYVFYIPLNGAFFPIRRSHVIDLF